MFHVDHKRDDDVWVFRYIPTGRFGDPYTFVCTGFRIDDTTIELVGALGEFSPVVWDGMYAALSTLGFKVFVERRNGKDRFNRVKPHKEAS